MNGKVSAREEARGLLSKRWPVHGGLGAWARVRRGRGRILGEGGGGGASPGAAAGFGR